MAPSSRTNRRQQTKQQPTLSSFSRISKSVTVTSTTKPKSTVAKELALTKLENDRKPERYVPKTTKSSNKQRKRDWSDSEDDSAEVVEFFSSSKRVKVQLPTPPKSPNRKRVLVVARPADAQELVSIFSAVLKAFALHRAHNGPATPAELSALLESVTRLYQRRSVTVIDLQRILGVFEQDENTAEATQQVRHVRGPFQLKIVGIGSNRRQLLELQQSADFSERNLQSQFESQLDILLQRHGRTVQDVPLLAFEMGAQTTMRQNKASETLKHILSGRKAELSMDELSISDGGENSSVTIKSRTLSLFDRVKAKQLATAAIDTPSAEVLRRKHAVARMAEVVEILRMKQQQKLGGYSGAGAGGKVSFAWKQLLSELRASMAIPMGDDELKLCLEILSKEVNDGWCTIFELGATKSVVLMGTPRSGSEIVKALKA
ncbi:uncharacterized protein AB675_3962 [Cyphellophora attinorum]|uniref:DNA replication factor Cdt1 C-terminal domain-containing protein n=1 Tax=Cyphellophora attinorum TaxID=1664694 RepID=A0A0N1H0Y4_9EURO|nr:uncharacterized protein AB675_3962 [Phialophora attinorum]KPI37570.1 hypothetical protein AB675_3962 [Phialophora attinorum]